MVKSRAAVEVAEGPVRIAPRGPSPPSTRR